MAKGSPKKDSPSDKKKNSPKDNKKNSPAKGKKESPKKAGKGTNDEVEEIIERLFARKRFEDMDAVFKRKSKKLILLCKRVHIWESWNKLPVITQMCNSNAEVVAEEVEQPKVLYNPAILEGVVFMNKRDFLPTECLYVEVVAEFRYHSQAVVPPIPPRLDLHHACYRDYYRIFPISFEKQTPATQFNQRMIQKCRDEFPGMDGYPFCFDLTQTPDSIILNRPHFKFPDSGLFWRVRCYVADMEYCKARPELEVTMNFWKYTYAPILPSESPRISQPMNYLRYETTNDIGDLILNAELERDTYYHGETISVTLSIENNSSRHVVNCVSIFVEQTVRIYRDVRQDYSIRLCEVLLQSPEPGLPMQPKSKSFTKKVELTPHVDLLLFNVGLDGLMLREHKFFLAGSTIILKSVPMTAEEIELEDAELEATSKGAKGVKGGKGSPGKKGSPDKSANSNKKGSPKESNAKKENSKKESPSKGSPEKKGKTSETENAEKEKEAEENIDEVKKVKEKQILTNKSKIRTVQIAYDIVVRLNLQTSSDNEAGNPQVRVPFALTRETWMIDKWTVPDPFLNLKQK